MYEDHADHRDKFEILAIHDEQAKTFEELDKKLEGVKKNYWQGKDLPFPVLLDAKGETNKLFGVRHYPTGILIDPEGKLVGESHSSQLEDKLPRLPATKQWTRNRDMQKNIYWSFLPESNTLTNLAKSMESWAGSDITLDSDAIKAAGLTPDSPLPGALIGAPVTLRSIEELLLAPHGLSIAPTADGKKLMITKRAEPAAAESTLQKQHNAEITERLDAKGEATDKPIVITDQTLSGAIKLLSKELYVPFAIDAKAMQTGKIDPKAKVNGSIDPKELRKSLNAMLEPLGLTLEVRSEAVVIKPKS